MYPGNLSSPGGSGTGPCEVGGGPWTCFNSKRHLNLKARDAGSFRSQVSGTGSSLVNPEAGEARPNPMTAAPVPQHPSSCSAISHWEGGCIPGGSPTENQLSDWKVSSELLCCRCGLESPVPRQLPGAKTGLPPHLAVVLLSEPWQSSSSSVWQHWVFSEG